MVRKVISNFANAGFVLLIFGFILYSVTGLWDWKAQVGVYGGAALILIYLVANFNAVKEMLSSRSVRMGGTALVSLLLVVGILALLNFMNFRHHKRFDFSEGGVHALSDQSKKILEGLKQDISVVGFYPDEAGGKRFRDLLDEYRYVSPKISYEVIDPQKDPSRVAQFEVTRAGQVVISAGAKKETIDDISEEKLTNAIIKVTRDTQKTVYFLTGHGERSIDDFDEKGYSKIKQAIEKQNYLVKSYSLAQENRIPSDAAVIISAGPTSNFFPNEVTLLEQYLDGGGKLLLLVDPAEAGKTGFEMPEFLSRYGLGLGNDQVLDASGLGQLFGFGPGAPLAGNYSQHPITRDISRSLAVFPGARSVGTTTSPVGFTATTLLSSTEQSWGETEIHADPLQFDEGKDLKGPVPLAAVSTKSVTVEPAGKGSEGSAENGGDVSKAQGPEPESSESNAPKSETREARIVLFGDSDFASNGFEGMTVNGDLFLNSVSWLAEDSDLLSIRPKDPANRSITMTGSEARLVFWASVILFPLATLIFGIAVWHRRR